MMISRDYKLATQKAYEVIEQFGINTLPIKLEEIISKLNNVIIKKYSTFMNNSLTLEDVFNYFGSNLGGIFPKDNKYYIVFNDVGTVSGLQRFTIAHELGHYFLGHIEEAKMLGYDLENLPKDIYKVYEDEANCFARNLLAPSFLVLKLKPLNKPLTALNMYFIFRITEAAVRVRLKLLSEDLKNSKDLPYENSELFKRYRFDTIYTCYSCDNEITHAIKYCPLCRNKYFKKRMWLIDMHYEVKYDLDEHGKAKICPKCKNEDNKQEGSYCKICGTMIVNRCSAEDSDINGNTYYTCNTISDANARYCTECGAETTFYKNSLLKDYTTEYDRRDEGNLPF